MIRSIQDIDLEATKKLLELDCNPNGIQMNGSTGISPLTYGLQDSLMTVLLLNYGADPNIKTPGRMSPFHYSAGLDNGTFQLLLEAGGNVNVTQGRSYKTPMIWAISNGHLENVKLLVEHGADIDPVPANECPGPLPDNECAGPLHYAVSVREIEIVKYLLEAGADPNSIVNGEHNGDCMVTCFIHASPLHWAVSLEDEDLAIDMIKELLIYGADINQKDKLGFTPLDYAVKMGRPFIVEYLLNCC